MNNGKITTSDCQHENEQHSFRFVAALFEDEPVFVDFSDEENQKVVTLDTDPLVDDDSEEPNAQQEQQQTNGTDESGDIEMTTTQEPSEQQQQQQPKRKKKKIPKHHTIVVSLSSDGNYIFTGTNKGYLNIISATTLETIRSLKVCNSNIKGIEICKNLSKIVINSSDRIARQYKLPPMSDLEYGEFELEHKYQDVVNRLQWNTLKFNHTGEYLCASTLGATHDIYIWETSMGSLIKILEGSNEELIDVDWNYRNVAIVANGMDTGMKI
ncbi:unnamed protein product [Ambrosiozyma monospora]|uniref:Unnamed protein product n=1 Tax=Ambrosiozyma monospora TaxID=43982 RepID=A0ACB5TMS1_AMBMO|nr:unnamed protein product [Ambrosiozyma monospora]